MSSPKLIGIIILKLGLFCIAFPFFIFGIIIESTFIGFNAGREWVEKISHVR